MLQGTRSRGWASDNDFVSSGENKNYYLCSGTWYRLLSPDSLNKEFNPLVIYVGNTGIMGMIKVYTGDGTDGGAWNKQIGGVRKSFRIMLLIIIDRGWASSSDSGLNKSYYLYNKIWYRTISPIYKWSDSFSYVMYVHDNGGFGDTGMYVLGGVL